MLDHLKYDKCPVCEAKVQRMTQWDQCHNGWYEEITFECKGGKNIFDRCEISYDPYSRKETIEKTCPRAHHLFVQKNK